MIPRRGLQFAWLAPLQGLWLRFLRKCLFLWVRTRQVPVEVAELSLDPKTPVVFAFDEKSVANLLVAEDVAIRNGLPRVFGSLSLPGFHVGHANFCLRTRAGTLGTQVVPRTPQLLRALCDYLDENPQHDVHVIPVTVQWGRSPDKEDSFFKLLFSSAWSMPGVMRKLFMILVHGRDTFIQLSPPLSLRQLLTDVESSDIAVRKVLRILRVHFRRQKEAMVGPDLSHRRTLLTNLMARPRVQAQIQNIAAAQGKPEAEVEAEALQYAREIAADYSYTVIRVLERILRWVWNRLYRGVRINHLQQVTAIARDYEIIYVPSHRSHIDYLLLSYALYNHGLVPPHIAAGVNLNMPVIGPILRRGGAFFMRRSFKGNRLYATVFSEYFYMIMEKGFAIEYFVEGGRSRTGRMLPPRTGMLSMTLKGYLQQPRKPVAFVPVYFGYEKILEGGSYVSELHGSRKKKETLGGFLASLRKLRESFGQVHVNFGKPILLESFLDRVAPQWKEGWNEDEQPEWFPQTVDLLAEEVVSRINAAAAINPVNLAAISLLATRRHAIEEDTLRDSVDFSVRLLQRIIDDTHVTIAEVDSARIIDYVMALGMVERRPHALGDVIVTDDANAILLTYFRNNVVHLFTLPSLIAALALNTRALPRTRIVDLALSLYPFVKAELFLPWNEDEARCRLESIVDFLIAEKMLVEVEQEGSVQLAATDMQSSQYNLLAVLGRATRPSLQRHYIVVRILESIGSGKLTPADLEAKAVLVAQRVALLFEFNSPEFADEKLFRIFIQKLIQFDVVTIGEGRRLQFSDALSALDRHAHRVLPFDVRRSIILTVARLERDGAESA